jgi:hypothetical protein
VRWSEALVNVSPADARAAHARLDQDGDGLVSTDDLLAAVRGFYFSEDPDGPGAWLFGPLT